MAFLSSLCIVLFFVYNSVDSVPSNQKSFQLVRPNVDHTKLEIIEDNLRILANIKEPISVIGIVGPYHSGNISIPIAFVLTF